MGAAGRKRAMARAVAPVFVQATITAAFSSTEARQAAATDGGGDPSAGRPSDAKCWAGRLRPHW